MQNQEQKMQILATIRGELEKLRQLIKTESAAYTSETLPDDLQRLARNAVVAGTAVVNMEKLVTKK